VLDVGTNGSYELRGVARLDCAMAVIIRPHRPRDLAEVIELLEGSALLRTAGRDLQGAIDLIGSDQAVVLVAEADGHLVGAAVGLIAGTTGWISRLGASIGQDQTAVSDRLLDQMQRELTERWVHKIAVLVTPGHPVREYFENRGYSVVENVVYLERDIPPTVLGPTALADLGGITIDRDLWDVLKGMDQAKEIIERRVILPLSEPELAERHAVQPPKAIVLFGPPGTGKTTFAKGISSRLEWPFIEIQPSELSADKPELEARALAQTLDRIMELPAAVVFVDEVEDLASIRHDQRKVSPRVTNEFLKQIPRFRQAPHHLLACATNSIGGLDPAFLRPGRFDYILPVGPPDAAARKAIWERYVGEITDQQVDIDTLVAVSEFFTPADIEFAAHQAAQRAFEQEHFEGSRERATAEDFLAAIRETKPTLSEEVIASFEKDVERFSRY
jgi:transitional endoplasmic reticulum ATPase